MVIYHIFYECFVQSSKLTEFIGDWCYWVIKKKPDLNVTMEDIVEYHFLPTMIV